MLIYFILTQAPPGAAETMPGDLAPPRKSHVFDRLQTTPKDMSEGIRTPKRQHSSRFDISDQRQRELEKLPGFHEVAPNRRQDLFKHKKNTKLKSWKKLKS